MSWLVVGAMLLVASPQGSRRAKPPRPAPPPAAAPAAAQPGADPRVVEAERLYSELEFEQAIIVATEAVTDADAPAPVRARGFVILGLSQAQIGRTDTARRSFASAIAANPNVAFPSPVPPKIRALIDGARSDAAAPPPPQPKLPPTTSMPPAVTPPNAPAPVTPVDEGPSALTWVFGSAAGVAVAGTLAVGAFGLVRYAEATAAETTQRDAERLGAEANTALAVAGIAGAVGVGCGVVALLAASAE